MSAEEWRRAVAPAKLNLRLEVLRRRADGFHELVTDLLAIDRADELRGRRAAGDGIALSVAGPAATEDVPRDERNLAWRAARRVQDEARRRGRTEIGLELALEKRVWSESGLGGASSDAAAAMLLADALLDLRLSRAWMGDRLAELGSDCRFFLDAPRGFARCTGRGERVTPLDLPLPEWILAVAVPAARCSTAAVYGALRLPAPPLPTAAALRGADAAALAASLGNQLAAAASAVSPKFSMWGAFLAENGGSWHLSGSGSALFRPCATKLEADAALAALRTAAAERELGLRARFCARAAGHGARLVG